MADGRWRMAVAMTMGVIVLLVKDLLPAKTGFKGAQQMRCFYDLHGHRPTAIFPLRSRKI
jgi:hypothetical protein